MQLVNTGEDPAPDHGTVQVALIQHLVGALRRHGPRVIAVLINQQLRRGENVAVVDYGYFAGGQLCEPFTRRITFSTPLRFRCSTSAFAMAWQSSLPGSWPGRRSNR
jgi:hypothetical protein